MHHLLASRRRMGDCSGVAAVEFAIIAPVLILLVGAAWDIGIAVERSIRLENAARTGAQYITRAPNAPNDAKAAADKVLSGYGQVTIGAMECRCPASGAVTASATVACDSSCPTGMARYVTVTATPPPNQIPLFPMIRSFMSSNGGAEANVVARLQ